MTVLVTGATGNTGSAVLAELARHDEELRGMVRSTGTDLPSGVTPVVGDFDDPATLRAALDGVRAAYLVTPSSERAEQQQLAFVDAAADAGVQRVVYLSQLAADVDSPVRFLRYHAVVENRIRERGIGFTFLRPNLFFQGLLAFAPMITATGAFGAPIGDAAVSALDVRDIGAVAARSLVDDAHDGATYTLTGPAAITHQQMATALSSATGREITFADVAPDDFAAALEGVLPPWQVGGTIEDYAHYARGEAAHVSDAIERVTGQPARDFASFARDYAAAFTPQ